MSNTNVAENISLYIHGLVSSIVASTVEAPTPFETNIGREVYRGKLRIQFPDDMPCIVLIEGEETFDQANRLATKVKLTQRFRFEAYMQVDDEDNPNDTAHKMVRDLKRALFREGVREETKKRAFEMIYAGKTIQPREDGQKFVQVAMNVDVSYVEDLTNP